LDQLSEEKIKRVVLTIFEHTSKIPIPLITYAFLGGREHTVKNKAFMELILIQNHHEKKQKKQSKKKQEVTPEDKSSNNQ
jgi:hypothetical protein